METRIGFGRRLGAFVIDFFIVFGITFIIANLFGTQIENLVDWSKYTDEVYEQMSTLYGNFTDIMIYMSVAGTFASFLYFIIEGFTGYTIDKLMLNIQVGNQDGTQSQLNKLMLRYALKNVSTIL